MTCSDESRIHQNNSVKEGGVGDKEMYLVSVGTWQAIVSVDYQGVVLHTELTP